MLAPREAADSPLSPQKDDKPYSYYQEELLPTNTGPVLVQLSSDPKTARHFLVTYHDIGTNASTCWQAFFRHSQLATLFDQFCVIHINAPGQQHHASELPREKFPSLSDMGEQVHTVLQHYGVKHFIGLAVGAGCNVMLHYAIKHPDTIRGLILISAYTTRASWGEYGSQLLSWLGGHNALVNQLINRWFSAKYVAEHPAEIDAWRRRTENLNSNNLRCFVDTYFARPDDLTASLRNLDFPVLMFGSRESQYDLFLETFSAMNPRFTSYFDHHTGGVLLNVECPDVFVTPIHLFLDGLGFHRRLPADKTPNPPSQVSPTS